MHIRDGVGTLGALPAPGYNLGADYQVKDVIKTIVDKTLGKLASAIGIGGVFDDMIEAVAAKFISDGLNKVDDFKNVAKTSDFEDRLSNFFVDTLCEFGIIPLWDGESEGIPAWDPNSHSGNTLMTIAFALLQEGVRAGINAALDKLGVEEIPEEDDFGTGGVVYGKYEEMDVLDAGLHKSTKPTAHLATGSGIGGMILPLAIGGAALLFFMGKK